MIDSPRVPTAPEVRSGRLLSLRPVSAGVLVLELALDRPLGFLPLQSVSLAVPGGGERCLPILSDPERADRLELGWFHDVDSCASPGLEVPRELRLRGPFGNGVDLPALAPRRVLLIGEGAGIAALRSLLRACLVDPHRPPSAASAFFGGRDAGHLAFREEIRSASAAAGLSVRWTVERPETGWDGEVGVVPALFRGLRLEPEGALAVLAGPLPLFKFVVLELLMRGLPEEAILVVPEKGPRCHDDPCEACGRGGRYACHRGPVFSWREFRAADGAR